MLTSSFSMSKGLSEDQERALWARGILSWELAKAHPDETAAVLGANRSQKLAESIREGERARAAGEGAWFKAAFPTERDAWRLWQGFCEPEQIALVDIETTGLTPGFDQITVIGLADSTGARVFVAGRPQAGDEPLERFMEVIKRYRLIVTFNGANFDLPFMEKHFRDSGFHFEMPHLDLLLLARSLGLSGGLKDQEKQLGIVRADDIKDMRGNQAIQLWGAWKGGDVEAYRKLTAYCKADCVNLAAFATELYRRKREALFVPHARTVDFTAIKGQQLTLF